MKTATTILFLFFMLPSLSAQRRDVPYLELAGAGIAYSLNYDIRFFDTRDNNGLGIRIGLGLVPFIKEEYGHLLIPFHLNYLIGNDVHKLEIGAGVTPYIQYEHGPRKGEKFAFPSGSIMYRYHSEYSPFTFRVGLSPSYVRVLLDDVEGHSTIPFFLIYPGASVGWVF